MLAKSRPGLVILVAIVAGVIASLALTHLEFPFHTSSQGASEKAARSNLPRLISGNKSGGVPTSQPQAGDLEKLRDDFPAWCRALAGFSVAQRLSILSKDPRLTNDSGPENRRAWQIIYTSAKDDPSQTISWLENHPSIRTLNNLWSAGMEGWSEVDIDAAFDYLQENFSRFPDANHLLSSLFARSLKQGSGWFEAHLSDLSPDLQYTAAVDSVWAWAGHDPKAAAKWILQFPPSNKDQPRRVGSAFAQWAKQSPDEAWRCVETLDEANYTAALQGYARGLTLRNLDEGLAFLAALKTSGRATTVLSTMGTHCANADPERGFQILPRLPDASDRRIFATAFLDSYNGSQPQRALAMLDELPPAQRTEKAEHLAEIWGRHDGPAAVAWAMAEPDGNTRARYLSAITSGWAASKPDAALLQAQTLPDAQTRDAALRAWCTTTARTSPRRAMSQAQAISNPSLRSNTVSAISEAWREVDVPGFEAWAAANSSRNQPPPDTPPSTSP
jgi:hypothetical protein